MVFSANFKLFILSHLNLLITYSSQGLWEEQEHKDE